MFSVDYCITPHATVKTVETMSEKPESLFLRECERVWLASAEGKTA
jgi:hypothetical protein